MRIVIVEDERPSLEKLAAAIRAAAPAALIEAALGGVVETIDWLAKHSAPDLLFLDIQLSDGLSFEILSRARVRCPVVFATAFDEYLMQAFECNGIDYLLKPIREERVAAALEKYRRLQEHFAIDYEPLLRAVGPLREHRQRLAVRKGVELLPLRIADVAYFFTSGKLVFATTTAGVRHLLDRPLAELEPELDPARFFRANRAYLVSIEAVARCSPFGKGRLLLELRPKPEDEVVVSQERAAAFRVWLGA